MKWERSAFNLKNAFKKLPKGIDRISHSVYAGNIKWNNITKKKEIYKAYPEKGIAPIMPL